MNQSKDANTDRDGRLWRQNQRRRRGMEVIDDETERKSEKGTENGGNKILYWFKRAFLINSSFSVSIQLDNKSIQQQQRPQQSHEQRLLLKESRKIGKNWKEEIGMSNNGTSKSGSVDNDQQMAEKNIECPQKSAYSSFLDFFDMVNIRHQTINQINESINQTYAIPSECPQPGAHRLGLFGLQRGFRLLCGRIERQCVRSDIEPSSNL